MLTVNLESHYAKESRLSFSHKVIPMAQPTTQKPGESA
jgi:hypothetical protein